MSLSNRFSTLARPSPIVRRALRDGLTVAGLAFSAYLFLVVAPTAGTFGFDAYAYWSLDLANPYVVPAGTFGAFTYTPVIARLFAPFGLLSWPAFVWLWSALLVGTVGWLGWRSALIVLAFPPVALELYHGNVHLLMAAAIALGFRYPVAWSFVLLTKVTPGVGLVWFAVRREWRPLAVALGFTAALVVASLLIDGRLWVAWLDESILKTASGAPLNQFSIAIPLLIRLPVAVLLVAWGGLTDRRWTVPVAATVALPILWPSGLAVLAALWPIIQRRPELEPG
jgi:glycosyl transferase family 87